MSMTQPSSSTPTSARRRWWIAPSVLVLGLYAGFFAFAVAQACTITTVTGRVNCVAKNTDGTYTAFFGYTNSYNGTSSESVGFWNEIVTLPSHKSIDAINFPTKPQVSVVPTSFTGNVNYAFAVNFSATQNPDGIAWQEGRDTHNNPLEQVALVSNTCAPDIHATTTTPTIMVGQTANFTASVSLHQPSPTPGNAHAVPGLSGTVLFTDENGHPLGAAVPVTPSGLEQINTTSLSVGTHVITATYSDAFYAPVSDTVTVKVAALASTCYIYTTPGNTVTFVLQPLTFTAVIGDGSGGTPTGTVDFYLDGHLKMPGAVLTNGQTSYISEPHDMTYGQRTVKAVYSGDANHASQTCSLTHQVNKVPTMTTVTSSVQSPVPGQAITFSADVAPVIANECIPIGSVNFSIDSGVPITVPLDIHSHASLPPNAALAIGSHSVKVTFSGDDVCDTSYGSLTQTLGTVPPPPTGSTSAYIRIAQSANLTSATTPVDVAIDNQTTFPGLKPCTINPYAPLSAGTHTVSVSVNGSQLKSQSISFTAGDYYTVAFVDNPSASPVVAPNLVVFQDDLSVAPGKAKVRVYHLNDSAGPISVAANGTVEVTSLNFENASSYFVQNPGAENYTITLLNHLATQYTDSVIEAANQVYGIFVMNTCTPNVVTAGIPTALPQTGFAPIQAVDWNAIVFFMGALAIIGAGVGGVSGLAVVQYRRRHR